MVDHTNTIKSLIEVIHRASFIIDQRIMGLDDFTEFLLRIANRIEKSSNYTQVLRANSLRRVSTQVKSPHFGSSSTSQARKIIITNPKAISIN
jgi:hypothetical protein